MSDPKLGLDETVAPDTLPAASGGAAADAPVELGAVDPRQYEILGELARGGLGRILRARDKRTGRLVAIKEVLRTGADLDARFAREALVTANLQHPAIVPVYEVGRWPSGEPFYAMKLVSGRSLEEAVAETRTLAERLVLLRHVIVVAEALAYAHGERVIHRDLKPANVLVGRFGETVVIDWGLAKNLATGDEAASLPTPPLSGEDADAGRTIAGAVLGTPAYMPPEQAEGDAVDERADVYAIGALLYDVLSGVRPYAEADGPREVLRAVRHGPPRPLAEHDREIPVELVHIVEKAMARRPADRYATAKELADDLVRFQTGKLVTAYAYSTWELVRRWLRRNLAAVTASAVGIVALAGFAAWSVHRILGERNAAERARAVAESSLGELYQESGRQLVAAGDPGRALPFLAEALRHGPPDAALRFLLGRALGPTAPLEQILVHGGQVARVQFAPDGKRLATMATDLFVRIYDVGATRPRLVLPATGLAALTSDEMLVAVNVDEIVLWDLTTATPRARLRLPDGDYGLGLAVAADRFAVGGAKGHVAVWSLAGEPIWSATTHASKIGTGLAFLPDGSVLGATEDGLTQLWPATGGEPSVLLDKAPVHVIVPAPGGDPIALGLDDGRILLAHADGRPATELKAHTGVVKALAWVADGMLISAGTDSLAVAWAPDGSHVEMRGHTFGVTRIAVSPDGRTVATAGGDGVVRLWDNHGVPGLVLTGHTDVVHAVAFAPDGKHLASGASDHTVRLWRLDVPPEAWPVAAGKVRDVALSPRRGDARFVAGTSLYDSGTGALMKALPEPPPDPTPAVWTAGLIAAGGSDGTVRVWRDTGEPLRTLGPHHGPVSAVAISPDGTTLVSGCDKLIYVWSLADGHRVEILGDNAGAIRSLRYSPDGERLAALTAAPYVHLYGVAGWTRVFDGEVGWPETFDATFSPDGSRLAVVTHGPKVPIFDGRAGTAVMTLVGHGGPVRSVDFAPDGARLASASEDYTVRVWNLGSGHAELVVPVEAPALSVRYRADGALLAAGAADEKVRVIDALGGRVLASFGQPGTAIVRWTDEGRRLVIFGPEKAWLWRVEDGAGGPALDRALLCLTPWRIDGGRLVAAEPDPDCGPL